MFPPPITSPSEVPITDDRRDLLGDPVHRLEVEADAAISGERLAGDLQQHAWVAELRHGRAHSWPIWKRAKRRIDTSAPAAFTRSRMVLLSSRTHG